MINSVTNNSLLILLFNANGLKNHIHELQSVLYNSRIDIALITETHFTKYSKFHIPGYHLIKTNHPDNTAHGGVALLIKTSLFFQPLPEYCHDYIQSCFIQIKLNNIPITIGALYSPPRHNITRDLLTDFFGSIKNNFIIGGDYNAKHQSWGCRVNNPRGVILHSFSNEKNFNILSPPGPTYWPTSLKKKPDILDIFAAKLPSNLHFCTKNLLDLNSDHSAVLLTISATPLSRIKPHKLFSTLTDHIKFHDIINENINLSIRLKSNLDIDEAVNNFTTLIQSAAWSAIKPVKTVNSNNIINSNFNYPIIPEEIRSLIVEKRRARARYHLSRLPSHKSAYNKLANSLKKILIKHKANAFEQKLHNLSVADCSLWRETKQLLKYKAPSTPLKKADNTLAFSDVEKAEVFQTYLSNIFQPHSDILDRQHMDNVRKYLDSPLPNGPPVKYTTPNEVKNIIQKHSNKKSPGFDLITAKVAKCLPKKAIVLLTYIFNAIFRLSYFPLMWKFSQIVMFAKPNKPPDSSDSYRPISLLPFFSKICERLILQRLSPHVISNNILPPSQFGFRAKHNTIHQVHRLVDCISTSLERKQYCSCVFLDISQAFDRVWHDGLLFKLRNFLPPSLFLLTKSYLTDRYFQIRIGTCTSQMAIINAGVPQGGILSPLLFNIYASDQPVTENTLVADYADDKALISIHENPQIASGNLQIHLNLMSSWYTKWRLKLNHTKSIHTTFTLKHGLCPPVSLDNIPIPASDTVKYLGLIIDKRLTWSPHIRSKRLILNSRSRMLKTILSKNKCTSLKNKLLIYKTFLKPIWTYGLQLWGAAKKSNLNKIQTYQNITLRQLTNAPPYISNLTLHNDLHIKSIEEESVSFYKRFFSRLANHNNPLISSLNNLTLPDNPRRRLKRRWCRDLLQ